MARHLFLALTNPLPGQEEEFNRWYDEEHVPDVLKIPGFVSAQRHRLSPHQRSGQQAPAWEYLTVYEVEGDDAEIHDTVAAAALAGIMRKAASPVFADDHVAWVFTPVGSRQERAEVESAQTAGSAA
jgi:hypothetical protein